LSGSENPRVVECEFPSVSTRLRSDVLDQPMSGFSPPAACAVTWAYAFATPAPENTIDIQATIPGRAERRRRITYVRRAKK
jgi:hypothetical protein